MHRSIVRTTNCGVSRRFLQARVSTIILFSDAIKRLARSRTWASWGTSGWEGESAVHQPLPQGQAAWCRPRAHAHGLALSHGERGLQHFHADTKLRVKLGVYISVIFLQQYTKWTAERNSSAKTSLHPQGHPLMHISADLTSAPYCSDSTPASTQQTP